MDGLVTVGGAIAVLEAVSYFAGEGKGTIAGASAASIAAVLWLSRPLFKELWFWVAIGVLAVLHVLAIFSFDWSAAARWTGLTFMPVAFVDIAVMMAVIYGLYRLKYGAPGKVVADSSEEPGYGDHDISL